MTVSHSKAFEVPLISGLIVLVVGCQSAKNEYESPPPPEVTVARPVLQPMTPFLEENGVIEAVEEAEVSARVQGFVEEIKFQPGALVSVGDLLYQIESDQYQAIVNSAKATVESAEAAIGAAKALVATAEAEVKVTDQNLSRERRLLDRNAGSQSDFDEAVAAKDAALAALDSAKANVEVAVAGKGRAVASLAQAQLDLDYTDVKSPINGRISITDVKQGNLVENGTKLAAVVNRNKVFVNFSISDRQLLRFLKERGDTEQPDEDPAEPDWSENKVYLHREVDEGFPFVGALNYIDQQGIDADTGTLGLRAEFENQQDQLYPGLFVTVRVPIGESREAMLIPQQAILRDQVGQYVLTVDNERKVQRTAILVDRIISGWGVINKGLAADTQIVVDGLQRARPGLEVKATERTLQVDDQALLQGLTPTGIFSSESAESGTSSQPNANDSSE